MTITTGLGNSTAQDVATYANFAVMGFSSVAAFEAGTFDGQKTFLRSWHEDQEKGGGHVIWRPNLAKSNHNGVTVFSPTVPYSNVGDYLNGVGETGATGNGCWVRQDAEYVSPYMAGALESDADSSTSLQAIIDLMNSQRIRILWEGWFNSHMVTGNGYTYIDCKQGGVRSITDAGSGSTQTGLRLINSREDLGVYTAVGEGPYPVGTGSTADTGTIVSYVDVPDGTIFNEFDVLYCQADTLAYPTYTGSRHGEIAKVSGIVGNRVYLDCQFRDDMGVGTVQRLSKERCVIKNLGLRSESLSEIAATPYAICSVTGFVCADVETWCDYSISRSIISISNLQSNFKHMQNSGLNDSPTYLGYGFTQVGASKANHISVIAAHCRHTYTDGVEARNQILDHGVCLDNVVTGCSYSTSSAHWDTHESSDGTIFQNIVAWNASQSITQPSRSGASAIQFRGTNHLVDGVVTNCPTLLSYLGPSVSTGYPRDTKDVIKNVQQRSVDPTRPSVTLSQRAASNASINIELIVENGEIEGYINTNSVDPDYVTEFRSIELKAGYPQSGSYRFLRTQFIDPPSNSMRIRAGNHYLEDVKIQSDTAQSEGFRLYQDANVKAVRVGATCPSIGYSRLFILNADSGITLKHSHCYLDIDSGTPGLLQDLGATAPAITNMAVA